MLVVGLYVILRPVDRNLALLALSWRLVECAILAAGVAGAFAALRLAQGGGTLQAIPAGELQAMAVLAIDLEGTATEIGFIFLGVGSAVFSWVWLKSRYIPRALAWLGIVGSLLLALGGVAIMLFPGLRAIGMSYMMPLGIYEVGLGLWLLVKGLREPQP